MYRKIVKGLAFSIYHSLHLLHLSEMFDQNIRHIEVNSQSNTVFSRIQMSANLIQYNYNWPKKKKRISVFSVQFILFR